MQGHSIPSYAPPYIREITQMAEIYGVQQLTLNEIRRKSEKILQGNFVLTSDEYFIRHYEKLLDIIPYKNSSLDDRKKRILSLLMLKSPITLKGVEKNINLLFPESSCKLIYCGEYKLTVKINPMPQTTLIIINDFLRKMLPANIIYKFLMTYSQELSGVIYTAAMHRHSVIIKPFITKRIEELICINPAPVVVYAEKIKIPAKNSGYQSDKTL